MVKRLNLATRAFGAEPGMPDVAALAAWIQEHRGRMADITTYQLDRTLAPQITAGIRTTCAGGRFYTDRIRECINGIADNRAVGELYLDTPALVEDAAGIVVQKKGAWCALPAPHVLGITDSYYEDEAEWSDAICGIYRTMMRTMRDTGVTGHILLSDTLENAELAALSRQNVFFYQPEPSRESLARLMEHQRQVASPKKNLETVFDLTDEYTLQKIFIIDPDPGSIDLALSHLDPDQVVCGGYSTENTGDYWKDLVTAAVYER
ncbi:hypothetical protein [uncultured Methanoregula sp.]|uniref:hypothetical protein n=1 Tax=uncultured Methanoregula sp. TaxID=1005933 RepID=UPI002AAAE897|nr:hypothetical protein [uncultured Methanoregula sp.]